MDEEIRRFGKFIGTFDPSEAGSFSDPMAKLLLGIHYCIGLDYPTPRLTKLFHEVKVHDFSLIWYG